jgi:hypothetical protein
MNRNDFWAIIDSSIEADGFDERLQILYDKISELPEADIIVFDKILNDLLNESYKPELFGAVHLMCSGCDDDDFDYFRLWLVAQGKKIYEEAVKHPDSLSVVSLPDELSVYEDFWYIAQDVYEEITGEEIPVDDQNYPDELDIEWDIDDEDEKKDRYPKLFNKYCS